MSDLENFALTVTFEDGSLKEYICSQFGVTEDMPDFLTIWKMVKTPEDFNEEIISAMVKISYIREIESSSQ